MRVWGDLRLSKEEIIRRLTSPIEGLSVSSPIETPYTFPLNLDIKFDFPKKGRKALMLSLLYREPIVSDRILYPHFYMTIAFTHKAGKVLKKVEGHKKGDFLNCVLEKYIDKISIKDVALFSQYFMKDYTIAVKIYSQVYVKTYKFRKRSLTLHDILSYILESYVVEKDILRFL